MKTLHDFQERAARVVYRKHNKGIPQCVVAPPGSGKTLIIARITQQALRDKKTVLIVCYRREAVFQTRDHLQAIGIDPGNYGFVLSGYGYQPERPVQIGTWSTLNRRELPEADTILFDEAHHAVCDSYLKMVRIYGRDRIIGFSATPYRMDNRGLGDVFDSLYIAAQPKALIRRKLLGNPRVFTVKDDFIPDLRFIRRAGSGDFMPGDLQREMDREELIGNVISHFFRHASDRRTLLFAVGIAHSQHFKERFRRKGVRAEHLDHTIPRGERERILADFRSGKTQVLCCCMILAESFDLPQCQAVILARPTCSFTLAMQQAGRGMRYYGNQRPIILDHAQNCVEFGLPHSDRDHQLSRTYHTIKSAEPVKVCPECDAVCSGACKTCPECGYSFGISDRIYMPLEKRGVLEEIDPGVLIEIRNRVAGHGSTIGADNKWTQKVMRALSMDV